MQLVAIVDSVGRLILRDLKHDVEGGEGGVDCRVTELKIQPAQFFEDSVEGEHLKQAVITDARRL